MDDSTYTTLSGSDLVRVSAATGAKERPRERGLLTPAGASAPLDVEDYEWSADHTKLLIFTNSARVWRENTRGDFWVLDLASHRLAQLGGAEARANPSTMQFAKFSPDGKRVGYVRAHDLYVESADSSAITRLTNDGSVTIINGTFDWVYEEELGMRDGFRWSPDGTHIAYWQLDASGVRDFLLINNTDSLYSFVKPIQYPKAGTTNSSAKLGVVSAAGGPTTWMQIPGDPRNNYIARMDWAANSTELTVQQLNRRQNVNTLWFATAATGAVRSVLVERDSAWIDIWSPTDTPLSWYNNAKSFVWLSERDGWQHAYSVGRDGAMKLITKGAYNVMGIDYIDTAGGWLYFYASPTNATQRFLWRARLDGTGEAQRLTPAGERGYHSYNVAPARTTPFTTGASGACRRAPNSSSCRRTRRCARSSRTTRSPPNSPRVTKGTQEFFQVDIGGGVKLDAWMMKPPGFDPSKKYPILYTIYGEPAAQTVLDAYGGARWLWDVMLTQKGYIVASVDNRGTPAPKGRAWRKAVLGQIGGLRVREQSAAAKIIGACPAWIPRASPCGDGAAAARARCSSCSARPTCTRSAWPSRRWPTFTITTRSIRSDTSVSPHRFRRLLRRVRREFRERIEGRSTRRARKWRRQRALPGHGAVDQCPRRRGKTVHDDGISESHARDIRGTRDDAACI